MPRHDHERDEAPPEIEPADQGISLSTIFVMIGFAYFPVSLGAGFIAFAGSRDARSIGGALVLTLIVALAALLVLRGNQQRLATVRMSNERLAAILLGLVGLMIVIGGIAGLSLGWLLGGVIVLAIAAVVVRRAPAPN